MDDQLLALSQDLHHLLQKKNLKITVAESCTGGGLSYYLSATPGASICFHYGFITYNAAAKTELLGVDPNILKTFGAVSEETAREMALGALDKSDADISVAITGLAGPATDHSAKPVGMVYIAFAKRDAEIKINHYLFSGNRQHIREMAIQTAFTNLLTWLNAKSF